MFTLKEECISSQSENRDLNCITNEQIFRNFNEHHDDRIKTIFNIVDELFLRNLIINWELLAKMLVFAPSSVNSLHPFYGRILGYVSDKDPYEGLCSECITKFMIVSIKIEHCGVPSFKTIVDALRSTTCGCPNCCPTLNAMPFYRLIVELWYKLIEQLSKKFNITNELPRLVASINQITDFIQSQNMTNDFQEAILNTYSRGW